jgi:hypothetical protein
MSARVRLSCLSLDARDVPSAATESFETLAVPSLPADGRTWGASNDGFVTTGQRFGDGRQALASPGTARTDSRYWDADPQPADAAVSVRLLSDGPAPLSLLARGSNLDTSRPTYVAAVVTPGGRQLSLVEVTAGSVRFLGTVRKQAGEWGFWYTLSLTPTGDSVGVQLRRPDTGQYLNPQGNWQVEPVDAIRAATTLTAGGVVGVARSPGAAGTAYFDQLTVSQPVVAPPPPAAAVNEPFDSTRAGQLPAGWQEWASDGSAGFGVVDGSLTAPGTSRTAARAWPTAPQPADVQAAATVFVDSLIPTGVVVRGTGLNTASPTFYGLTAVRGAEVRLTATVAGVETTLGTVRSRDYVSQKWLRLTLTAVGDQLRAVIARTDTGRWLTPDGDWSDLPQPALSVTDGRLTAGGQVGVSRSARAAGTVRVDDFTVTPGAAVRGPDVALTSSQPGAVAGDVTVTASAAGARRVEFRLNGVLRSVATGSPATWTLDSTTLANGSAVVTVRATDDAGNVGTATLTLTVVNPNPSPPPARPDLPRRLPNVRVAQLAYSNTPLGGYELGRLSDSVDLVVANPQYQAAIDAVAPDTHQLLYTNVSNLYGGLLTDWLAYADATGVDREQAFYHVTAATPFNGGSPSSMPVNWLWQVSRATTDLTAAARGGRTFGVAFGQVGEAVTVGYPDEFRELNFDLTTAAGNGWAAAYEYVSRANADGSPAEWKPLYLLSDGTAGLTRPGRVLFDPPPDWVPARVNGGESLYTVRLRTTTGGTVPEAKTIFGRDYVGAFGTIAGTIPAFDATADTDRNGYLTDAEFAGRRPGFDARFVHESRLFYPQYGQMRFVTNPSATSVRRWAAEYHQDVLAGQPLSDGLFIDNANGRLPFAGIPVQEPTANYADDSAGLVAAVWKAVAPRTVFGNTAGGFADADGITRAGTGVVEEFVLRATDATWAAVQDVAGLVRSRLAADSPSPYVVLDTHPGNGFATTDPRVRSAALAYYYLVADPDRTFVMFFGGLNPSAAWADTWIPAVQTDLGRPLGDLTTVATGTDPANPALAYRVYGREYANARVLYKPRSYTLRAGTGTTGDDTATTHQLGGNFRLLASDGTPGPVVTSVTLRNGEGAILIRA